MIFRNNKTLLTLFILVGLSSNSYIWTMEMEIDSDDALQRKRSRENDPVDNSQRKRARKLEAIDEAGLLLHNAIRKKNYLSVKNALQDLQYTEGTEPARMETIAKILNYKDKKTGWTPLHLATHLACKKCDEFASYNIVIELLNHPLVEINPFSFEDKTPLDIAYDTRNHHLCAEPEYPAWGTYCQGIDVCKRIIDNGGKRSEYLRSYPEVEVGKIPRKIWVPVTTLPHVEMPKCKPIPITQDELKFLRTLR